MTGIRVRNVASSRIRRIQGSSTIGTGNRFIRPTVSFANETSNNITYYWDSRYPNNNPVPYNSNKLTVLSTNNQYCPKGIGYTGDWHYIDFNSGDVPTYSGTITLASLANEYDQQQELFLAKQTAYKQKYANKTIDWNAIKTIDLSDDPQISSYMEIADISQNLSEISREAFQIIFKDTVFDRNEFNTWLQRENTIRSYYTLAESYVEMQDWTNAKKILDKIPALFPDYDKTQHKYYEILLNLQYQWKGKERSEISQNDIRILESIFSDENGIASIKARTIWDCIHDTNSCPHPEGICGQEMENEIISTKTQKSMGENNSIIQNEMNNDPISVNIHPNPARNTVFISLDKQPQTSVNYQLYEIQGKEFQNGTFSGQQQELDISSLSKGIYFISVTVENQTRITKKVVKE